MNLSAYDNIAETIKDTYVHPLYKRLYSKSLPYYLYYGFIKRFNPTTRTNKYYIILSNKKEGNINWFPITRDKNNTIKINLDSIWNISNLRNINAITNVNVVLEDKQDDCEIYYLDV